MNEDIKETIQFVLKDDNELMEAALASDSDRDEENKQIDRELIQRHNQVLAKLGRDQLLSQEELQLVRDANETHLNDTKNLKGRHAQAVDLDRWLDHMMELDKEQAMHILEEWLDRDSHTPARVYRALHTLWEEATPNGAVTEPAFDDQGRCLKCGSQVSFADVTDTVVFVGDGIVKRYAGDISNRNCVRCMYPKQYGSFAHFDSGDEKKR